jgi:hypothetical protein
LKELLFLINKSFDIRKACFEIVVSGSELKMSDVLEDSFEYLDN